MISYIFSGFDVKEHFGNDVSEYFKKDMKECKSITESCHGCCHAGRVRRTEF